MEANCLLLQVLGNYLKMYTPLCQANFSFYGLLPGVKQKNYNNKGNEDNEDNEGNKVKVNVDADINFKLYPPEQSSYVKYSASLY